MSDLIRYDYASNYAGLEDIQGGVNESQAMREEVSQLFNALREVYEGQAAAALHETQVQITNAMDAVIAEIEQTRRGGNQSQEDAAALDAHLAGGFST